MRITREIHHEVSQQSVYQPRWNVFRIAGRRGRFYRRHLFKSDLKFIELFITPLIYSWCLTRRSDKRTRKKVGQTWVVLPIRDKTSQ